MLASFHPQAGVALCQEGTPQLGTARKSPPSLGKEHAQRVWQVSSFPIIAEMYRTS